MERDFQGGAEGVVRDLQWRSDEGVVMGLYVVGYACHCRAVSMLGWGFNAGVLMSVWGWKGSNSSLWVWGWRRPQCRAAGMVSGHEATEGEKPGLGAAELWEGGLAKPCSVIRRL